jgi:hypothetical protein
MSLTRRPKWARLVLPLLLVGAVTSACGGDGDDGAPTEVTLDQLAGTWNATSLFAQRGAISLQLVGATSTVTLVISDTGRFTLTVEGVEILEDVTVTGTFEITGSGAAETTIDGSSGDPLPTTFSLSGNTLSVTIEDAAVVDIQPPFGTIDENDAVTLIGTLERA